MPYRETINDLQRKWMRCWVLMKGQVGYITLIDVDSEEKAVWHVKWAAGRQDMLREVKDRDVVEFLPPSMMVNLAGLEGLKNGRGGVYFERLARRQYRRSLCGDLYTLITPYHEFSISSKGAYFGPAGLDGPCVLQLHKPEYPSLTDACEMCLKAIAVAVSTKFLVLLSPLDKDLLLYTFNGYIGKVKAKEKTIELHYPDARQEVLDFLSRTSQLREWNITHA